MGDTLPTRHSHQIEETLARANRALAIVFLVFGILTIDFESKPWLVIHGIVYGLPILLCWTRFNRMKALIFWIAGFFMAQAVASSIYDRFHGVTLPHSMSRTLDYRKTQMSGMHGLHHITTDEKGYRTTTAIDYTKKKNLRIIAIGGSTTEQILIDDKKTWTALLEKNLSAHFKRPIEVINTGISGAASSLHVTTLKNVLRYQPDMIVVLLGVNDWNKDIRQRLGSLARNPMAGFFLKYSLFARALSRVRHMKGREIRAAAEPEEVIDPYSNMRGSLKRKAVRSLQVPGVADWYRENLATLSTLCRANSIVCVFANQPHGYQAAATESFKNGLWMTPPFANYTLDFASLVHLANTYNAHLQQFASTQGHPFVDLAEHFPPTFEYFVDDVHFNEAGAARVAALLLPPLTKLVEQLPQALPK